MLANQGYGINSDADDDRLVPEWAGQRRGGMLQKTMKAIGKVKITGKSKKKQNSMELMNSDSSMQYRHPDENHGATDSDGEHEKVKGGEKEVEEVVGCDRAHAEVNSEEDIADYLDVDDGNGTWEPGGQEEIGEAGNVEPSVGIDDASSPVFIRDDKTIDDDKGEFEIQIKAEASWEKDHVIQFHPRLSALKASMPETPNVYTPGQRKKRSLIPKLKKGLGTVMKIKNGAERNKKKSMELMESVASMDFHLDGTHERKGEISGPSVNNHLDDATFARYGNELDNLADDSQQDEEIDAPKSMQSLPTSGQIADTLEEDYAPETPRIETVMISGVMQFDPSGIATQCSFPQTPVANTRSNTNVSHENSPSSVASPGLPVSPRSSNTKGETALENQIASQSGEEVQTKVTSSAGQVEDTVGQKSGSFGSSSELEFGGRLSKINNTKEEVESAAESTNVNKRQESDETSGKTPELSSLSTSQDPQVSATIPEDLDNDMKLDSIKEEKVASSGNKDSTEPLCKSPVNVSKMPRRSKHGGKRDSRRSKASRLPDASASKVGSSRLVGTQDANLDNHAVHIASATGSLTVGKTSKGSSSSTNPSSDYRGVSWKRVVSSTSRRTEVGQGHSPKPRKSSAHACDSPSRRLKRPALTNRKKSTGTGTGTSDENGGVSWKRVQSSKPRRISAERSHPDRKHHGLDSPSRSSKRDFISGSSTSHRIRRRKHPSDNSCENTDESINLLVSDISSSLMGQPATSLREIRRLVEASTGGHEDLNALPSDSIPPDTAATVPAQTRSPTNRRTSRRLQRLAARAETVGPLTSPRNHMKHSGSSNDDRVSELANPSGDNIGKDGSVDASFQIDINEITVPSQNQNTAVYGSEHDFQGDSSEAPIMFSRSRPSNKKHERSTLDNHGEGRVIDAPSRGRGSLRIQKVRKKRSGTLEFNNEKENGYNKVTQVDVGKANEAAESADAPIDGTNGGNNGSHLWSLQSSLSNDGSACPNDGVRKHPGKKKPRQHICVASGDTVEPAKEDKTKVAGEEEEVRNTAEIGGVSSSRSEKTSSRSEKTDVAGVNILSPEFPLTSSVVEDAEASKVKASSRDTVKIENVDSSPQIAGTPPMKVKPRRVTPCLSATLQMGAMRKGHQHMDDQSVFSDAFGSVVGDAPGFKPDNKLFPEIQTVEETCAPQLIFNPKENDEGVDVQVLMN